MRESSQSTFVIVIKLNNEEGVVRFFKNDQNVNARKTSLREKKTIKIIFLSVNYSCQQINDACVKYITYMLKDFTRTQC